MAGNTFSANAFANNFMTGFSFVDEIKRQKKADQRLEERLAQEKEERSFQRSRQVKSDKRIDTLFGQQQEDRVDALEEERLREEGDQFALQNPDATPEELAQFAPYSPEAAAALKRQNEQNRISGAIRGAGTIPRGGQQPAGAVTQAQGNQSLSGGVQTLEGQQGAPTDTATLEQRGEAAAGSQAQPVGAAGFNFAPDKGLGGLQEIDIDEASQFDPEYQKKGFLGKVGDKIAGGTSEVVRGAEDVAGAVLNAPGKIANAVFGLDRGTSLSQNAGDEFGGNLQVPADRFTSTAEFEQMAADGASQQEITAARNENVKVLEEYKRRGRRPQEMAMDAHSRQGALLEGSDQARQAAELAGQQAEKRAEAFLDPAIDSTMEQVAVEDPRAATVMYLEDRATLQTTNPGLAWKMDQRMLPILNQAEADLKAETLSLDPESPQGRQQRGALANLQHSRDQIAKNAPSVSRQSGINASGLKVGDNPRVQDVADTMFDPNRPVPTQNTGAQVHTAGVVAGRITPNKRLNENQIESLSILAQAGYIDKPTALSVMMTGAWPPGKNPNGITKIQEAGDNVYAITESGNVLMLQKGKTKVPKPTPSREIGEDQINWVSEGIKSQFPNIEDNDVNGLMNIMYKKPGWVRSRFNVTSQEDMRKLGAMLAESKLFAGKKFAELDEGWFTNTKESPTVNEIMMDPDLREKLANEFDLTYIPLPDLKDIDGLDEEAMRQGVREGRYGPIAAENADSYADWQIREVVARSKYMELDAQGRIAEDGTILPAPQGQ